MQVSTHDEIHIVWFYADRGQLCQEGPVAQMPGRACGPRFIVADAKIHQYYVLVCPNQEAMKAEQKVQVFAVNMTWSEDITQILNCATALFAVNYLGWKRYVFQFGDAPYLDTA